MPIEIKVGPPTVTISQGRTFMVTTQSGDGPCTISLRFRRKETKSYRKVLEMQADEGTAQEDQIQVMEEPEIAKYLETAHF